MTTLKCPYCNREMEYTPRAKQQRKRKTCNNPDCGHKFTVKDPCNASPACNAPVQCTGVPPCNASGPNVDQSPCNTDRGVSRVARPDGHSVVIPPRGGNPPDDEIPPETTGGPPGCKDHDQFDTQQNFPGHATQGDEPLDPVPVDSKLPGWYDHAPSKYKKTFPEAIKMLTGGYEYAGDGFQERLSQSDISKKLGIEKTILSRFVKKCIDARLITKTSRWNYEANPLYFPWARPRSPVATKAGPAGHHYGIKSHNHYIKMVRLAGYENEFAKVKATLWELSKSKKIFFIPDSWLNYYGKKQFGIHDFRVYVYKKTIMFHPIGWGDTHVDALRRAGDKGRELAKIIEEQFFKIPFSIEFRGETNPDKVHFNLQVRKEQEISEESLAQPLQRKTAKETINYKGVEVRLDDSPDPNGDGPEVTGMEGGEALGAMKDDLEAIPGIRQAQAQHVQQTQDLKQLQTQLMDKYDGELKDYLTHITGAISDITGAMINVTKISMRHAEGLEKLGKRDNDLIDLYIGLNAKVTQIEMQMEKIVMALQSVSNGLQTVTNGFQSLVSRTQKQENEKASDDGDKKKPSGNIYS